MFKTPNVGVINLTQIADRNINLEHSFAMKVFHCKKRLRALVQNSRAHRIILHRLDNKKTHHENHEP